MTFKTRVIALTTVAVVALGSFTFYMTQAGAEDAKAAAATTTEAGAPAGKPLKDVVTKSDDIYATFEGGKVTGKEVQEFISKMPPQLQQAPSTNLLPMVVNQMVNDRLVDKAVIAEKLADDKIVKQRIDAATEQILRSRFVEKSLEGKVSDADVKKKYDEATKKLADENEVRARHILVADEKTATDVIAKLNKGGDFAKLAQEYSTDATKSQGGDLGYFVKEAMVPEFGNAAFAMKKGEVSKTPIKTQFGYHVIKIEDVRKRSKPAFDTVKENIRNQLSEEQFRKLVETLRTKAKVQVTIPQS